MIFFIKNYNYTKILRLHFLDLYFFSQSKYCTCSLVFIYNKLHPTQNSLLQNYGSKNTDQILWSFSQNWPLTLHIFTQKQLVLHFIHKIHKNTKSNFKSPNTWPRVFETAELLICFVCLWHDGSIYVDMRRYYLRL